MKSISRVAAYLQALPEAPYRLPPPVASVVNYLLDSFFAKSDQRCLTHDPIDPASDIKEQWIGCEINSAIDISRSYPNFAKSRNAWAFTKLFTQFGGPDCVYEIVPFLESYKYKDYLKREMVFKNKHEPLQIDANITVSLPVFGTFFVRNNIDDTHLVVFIDLIPCFDMVCKISVIAHPTQQAAAEKFLTDLDLSIQANDIYFRKCLFYNKGYLDFVSILPTTWQEIILKDKVKDRIRDNSIGILKNMEILTSVGMSPNRNVILISPPGMAKTTIFRAISNEINQGATRLWCTGKSIEYSEHVTALFAAARTLAPCVIFIEDMDLFGGDRSTLGYGHSGQVLNEFLAQLDGVQANAGVIVLASTNDIASMDEALVNRPGRFSVKVEIPYPDLGDRAKMIGLFFKSMRAAPDETVSKDTWDTVLGMTEGFTGDYIKELAKCTVIRAVNAGRGQNGRVIFNSDDITSCAEQVLQNYAVGQKAKKHHDMGAKAVAGMRDVPEEAKSIRAF